MKKIVIVLLICSNWLYSQDPDATSLAITPAIERSYLLNSGIFRGFDLQNNKVKGTPFLYDEWNKSVILLIKKI